VDHVETDVTGGDSNTNRSETSLDDFK